MGRARSSLGATAALVAAALAPSGCGFTTRSSQFECDVTSECPSDRTCVQGWCVLGSSAPDASTEPVVCSAGEPCQVVCSSDGSCAGGVDCSQASSCSITCSGVGSCAGPILCGPGRCEVDCSGVGSCTETVDCAASCACVLDCAGTACFGAVSCPYDSPCKSGKECDDTPAGSCDLC